MFEKIKAKLKEYSEKAKLLEEKRYQKIASNFNDDIAQKTEWKPLKRGGANFQSHTLTKQSATVLKYQLSKGGMAFISVFAVIGLGIMFGGAYVLLLKGKATGWLMLGFGSIFFGAAVFMFRIMGKPTYFDRSMGIIYKGNKVPKLSGNQQHTETTYFADIHAIQILQEYVRSDKSSYYSYEINLVMKDASRRNIADFGKYDQIAIDAQTLSEFLGKPVWDAVNF